MLSKSKKLVSRDGYETYLKIESNWHDWDIAKGRKMPVYVEILEDWGKDAQCIGLDLDQVDEMIEYLQEVREYLNEV